MYTTLGHRMAEAWRNTGLSQTAFAKAAGIEQTQMNKLLNGNRKWNEYWIEKANNAFVRLGFDPVLVGAQVTAQQALPPPGDPDIISKYEAREKEHIEREKWLREMVDDLKKEVSDLKGRLAAGAGTQPIKSTPEANAANAK